MPRLLKPIVKFEVRYWLKQFQPYIFGIVLFVIGMAAMLITGDILDEQTPDPDGEVFANSAKAMYADIYGNIMVIMLFLLPAIYGAAWQRDFTKNTFKFLYAYPIKNETYFLSKFISSSIVAVAISFSLGLGMLIGECIPGLDPAFIGQFNLLNYFNIYLCLIIPTILFLGALIFSLTALTRNIYSGFGLIIGLVILRMLLRTTLGHPEYIHIAAYLDPYGIIPVLYDTQDWSTTEINTKLIPLYGSILINRLTWGAIASVVFIKSLKQFTLSEFGFSSGRKKRIKRNAISDKNANINWIDPKAIKKDYSFFYQLKSVWTLSSMHFKSIVFNRIFLAVFLGSAILMIVLLGQVNPELTVQLRPFTQIMLQIPTLFYAFLIGLLTFIYVGFLVHRPRVSNMNQLIDVTPTSTFVFILSRFLAMLKTQALLLFVILLVGIGLQAYRGFFHFEIDQYLFQLYGLTFIGLVLWACLSFFVHALIPNQYVGILFLILFSIGVGGLDNLGIKDDIFKYASIPRAEYSDLHGYDATLKSTFAHQRYWLLGGLILLIGAYLIWIRGSLMTLEERWKTVKHRFSLPMSFLLLSLVGGMMFYGHWIYGQMHAIDSKWSKEEIFAQKIKSEKNLEGFFDIEQPKLQSIKMEVDLFPDENEFQAKGIYLYRNQTKLDLDTIWINNFSGETVSSSLNKSGRIIFRDTILHFELIDLDESLKPGETVAFIFHVASGNNSKLNRNENIKSNGTFFMPEFPSLGISDFRITNNKKRTEFDLPKINNNLNLPSDTMAVNTSYVQTDFINYEAVVSTSIGQRAIAVGQLDKEWMENGRHYFHYKNEDEVRNGFIYHSGDFEIEKQSYKGVDLEIYHHADHYHNIPSMMESMRATLDYCTEYFGPYQFDQMRIVEFPKTYGNFAQSFAHTICYSEFAGFLINIDTSSESGFDSPFRLTAHEMAHQWWGHQVVPADVLGSKFVTEGMAEYVALKVLERHRGRKRAENLLYVEREVYARGRRKNKTESPLSLVPPNQNQVAYQKGCLVLNTLSNYIGEEVLNAALGAFVAAHRMKGPPYPTSFDMIDHIKNVTPDSLQYLVTDLLENVIFYKHGVENKKVKELVNGQFILSGQIRMAKYISPKRGEKYYEADDGKSLETKLEDGSVLRSLPLRDYVDVSIFAHDDPDRLIYQKRMLFTEIISHISIDLSERPGEVVIDADQLLLVER